MKKVIFATGNSGKMKEIRMILKDLTIEGEEVAILSMKEARIQTEIVEDGGTFAENALIKAKAVAACAQGAIVLADDSGLEIDPVYYCAGYVEPDGSAVYPYNLTKLLYYMPITNKSIGQIGQNERRPRK